MAKYIKNFVTGHGITFERSKRNAESFEKASFLWKEIGDKLQLNGRSIVMFCGAKNNGKSSLVRYLLNRYNGMNSKEEPKSSAPDDDIQDIDAMDEENEDDADRYAYLIDFDPGQPETTSSGIISAHIIRATAPPLQSPSYLNVLQHEPIALSSVGGTNMSVNPRLFIENSRYIYNQVIEHRDKQTIKRPVFINTMGHIRNVGLAMLMDLIKICHPTNLIVLNVESDPMRTIYADLSPQAISNVRASFYYEVNQQDQKKLNYNLDMHDLKFSFTDSTSIATKNRTALQLAYMGSMSEALYKPIMQLNCKWLNLKSVSIFCASSYPLKETIVFELLFHSWIHLVRLRNIPTDKTNENESDDKQTESICKLIDEVGENELYGCGIITNIDIEKKRLAIITPIKQDVLDNCVNCVIKPLSIQVPRELIQADQLGMTAV